MIIRCLLRKHKWDARKMPRPTFKGSNKQLITIAFMKCRRCNKVSFCLLQGVAKDNVREGYAFDAGRSLIDYKVTDGVMK